MWILPTAIEQEGDQRYSPEKYFAIPPHDARTMGVLITVLRKANYRFPRRHVRLAHRFDHKIHKDNLAVMCLPMRNCYSRVFLGMYFDIYVQGKNLNEVTSDENLQSYLADTDTEMNYFGFRKIDGFWHILDFEEVPAKSVENINHQSLWC